PGGPRALSPPTRRSPTTPVPPPSVRATKPTRQSRASTPLYSASPPLTPPRILLGRLRGSCGGTGGQARGGGGRGRARGGRSGGGPGGGGGQDGASGGGGCGGGAAGGSADVMTGRLPNR